MQRVVEAINAPAYVRNGRLDILAANHLGRALYAPVFDDAGSQLPNMARFIFLNARASEFFADWQNSSERRSQPFSEPKPDEIPTTDGCRT